MLIANPLYDHAFKYLMSNDKLARKVLSVILDQEVLHLELVQQEYVVPHPEKLFTLYRLDFKATILTEEGREQLVLIELQKSRLPTVMRRFRSYLGESYRQAPKVEDPASPYAPASMLPIIAIYILGYNVEDIPYMATKVDRRIINASTQEEVELQSDFIDLLTHPMYILQVRRLPEQRRTRLEQFMSLFNQAWVMEDRYVLNLEDVPEEFRDIARYLERPLKDEHLRQQLHAEQELEEFLAIQEANMARLTEDLREALIKREEERRLKEATERQKEEERRQKEEVIYKLARLLKSMGRSSAEIIAETGLAEDQIETI